MATTTSTASAGTSGQATSSTTNSQVIRQELQNQLAANFGSTLNTVPDILNICMGLCQQEGSLNPSIGPGSVIPLATSSGAKDYWNSTAVQSALAAASPQQRNNLNDGLRAWGITQVTGWNVVRGASVAGNGKTLIESSRPDLASQLMVNPGDSIQAMYNGVGNLNNMILAGLVILESKFKAVKGSGTSFTIGKLIFSSKIAAAVAGYYGLSLSANPTPFQYSASVMTGGRSYFVANNGGGGTQYASNPSVANPVITIASGNNQQPPGC